MDTCAYRRASVEDTGALLVATTLDAAVAVLPAMAAPFLFYLAAGDPLSLNDYIFPGDEQISEIILIQRWGFVTMFLICFLLIPLRLGGATLMLHLFGFRFRDRRGNPPAPLPIALRSILAPITNGIGVFILQFSGKPRRFDPLFGWDVFRR